jgi:hypothetical protein
MGAWQRFGGVFIGLFVAATVAVVAPSCGGGDTGQGGSGGHGGKATSTTSSASGGTGGGCAEPPQTAGDCKKNVCEGSEVKTVPDDTDVPDDGHACTADSCSEGEIKNTPVPAGTPCAEDGGKVCDGEGSCVGCQKDEDCGPTEVCGAAKQCVDASCADGVKNGDETDVDCGGACLATCAPGQACSSASDCLNGVCKLNTCLVPTCSDGVKNGDETDVDCGGACASAFVPKKCGPGLGCTLDGDCAGDACSGTVCLPSCTDGVQNGDETGVDCGGATCPVCGDGETCAGDVDCASGHCAGGTCCDTACAAPCDACSAAAKASGPDGVCGPAKSGTPCGAAPTCAAGSETLQDTCDGSGVCVDQGVAPCSPYTCGASTCKTSCVDDGDCAAPATCAGGLCALPLGGACAKDADCASGACADGVCCDTPCAGVCQACSAAKKGSGADGACGDVLSGTDPDNECAGVLNCGVGKCQIANGQACTAGADCVSGNCVDGVCCNGPCAGVCQACTAAKKGGGNDGICGNIAINLDPDDECSGSSTCNGSGACALSVNGSTCASGSECTSGNCVDGVCCNTACSGTCLACTAAKKGAGVNGLCGAIAAGTDPDDECQGATVCASGGCRLPDGLACASNTECISGFCADGVCCNTNCTTTCQACTAAKKGSGTDGVCGNIAAGTDPDDECGGPTTCSGSASCALKTDGAACAASVECGSGFCVDGVCCDALCTGLCQACTNAKKGSGTDGTCAPIAAFTDPDDECPGAAECDGSGACVLHPNGMACTVSSECTSGFCADGVCCNTSCTATCNACTAAKRGQGADGTCGTILVGMDPDNECPGAASCSGSSSCSLFGNGTACTIDSECSSGFCVDGVCCNSVCNSSCQACTAAKKGSGTNGTCGNIASGSDPDDECPGAEACNGGGLCKLPNGAACTAASDCLTNFCVDGVCCNATCTGACQACTAVKKGSGADGTCSNIATGTDPDNECGGAASCNGSGACALFANGTACAIGAECSTGNCVDGVCCNSACNGTCQACTATKKGSGADGTCGNIVVNTDPDDECPGTQICNGSAACKAINADACTANSDCLSNFCADGVCCNAACTGACQACTGAKKGSGADGTCGNIAMGTDPDDECFGSYSCNGSGACALLTNGTACTTGSECVSGNCVDGVCCNTACNALCQACTALKKGSGADGTCSNIAALTDPDDECPGSQACNGSGSCKSATGDPCVLGTECSSGQCVDGVCCNTSCTATCNACTALKKGSGPDGVCGTIAAGTDPDNECFGSISCSGASSCALLANGTTCAAGGECSSGQCVDGVCCNSACNNLCQACSAVKKGSGTDGTCGAIAANLDPDDECAGVLACNGSSLCKLPLAEPCLVNTDCISNACVDGVCCNTTCTGSCQACSAAKKGSGPDGVCAPIAVGTDPDNECFGAITCNGAGACGTNPNGTACMAGGECASGNCVDGVCCNSACNTLCQACTATKKGSGIDGTCGAIAANLDPDDECPGTLACTGSSTCKLPLGEPCLVNTDCISNACADGVCCNTTCTTTCNACTAAKKGSGPDGVCAPIAAGTDPDNECFGSIDCNGANACALLANGTACTAGAECSTGQCVDGVCCNSACNSLCQACTAAKKNSGADGTCGSIAAGTDPDNECAGATLCSGSTSCALLTNGTACTMNSECSSGNCVDGVCCNAPCNGACQACTTAQKGSGANGTCGNIAAGTDPDDECPGATACNAAQACGLFGDGLACTLDAECVNGNCVDGVCCNVACNGLCQACVGSKTMVSDGTCADIVPGTDPDNECDDLTSSPVCGGAMMCGP